MRSIIILLFSLMTPVLATSAEFNDHCQEAMRLAFDLKMSSARELLNKEKSLDTGNTAVDFLDHFCDALELIVTEDKSVFVRMSAEYDQRFNRLKAESATSPLAAQLLAELVFHQGLAQVRYGNRLGAVSKILSVKRMVENNHQRFPGHKENLKMEGIFNLVADNIPPFLKWAARLLGIKGDAARGMDQLLEYAGHVRHVPGLREESIILVLLGYKLLGEEARGFEFTRVLLLEDDETAMVRYFQASLASYCYRNELALELLTQIRRDSLEVPFWGMDYLYGRCLMNRIDPKAVEILEKFLQNYPGEDFKKDVCHRLAFACLFSGDVAGYEKYRSLTLTVGVDERDRDREAMIESKSAVIPHTGLLKARLWFDGGYFAKAHSMLREINPLSLNPVDKLEYHYRLGRLFQETGDTAQSIQELMWTVNYGYGTPNTWSVRAALQLGRIYESLGETSRALEWYDKCLQLYDPKHTVESVEQLAKNGKWRMEN